MFYNRDGCLLYILKTISVKRKNWISPRPVIILDPQDVKGVQGSKKTSEIDCGRCKGIVKSREWVVKVSPCPTHKFDPKNAQSQIVFAARQLRWMTVSNILYTIQLFKAHIEVCIEHTLLDTQKNVTFCPGILVCLHYAHQWGQT